MIDSLFGSKTRVKLLHLFLNNPGKAFYVREITRLIDEQINSVRRELANMLDVGIITSQNTDNRLYYEVNQRYEHYVPFRAMFTDQKVEKAVRVENDAHADRWQKLIGTISGARVVVAAGVLVKGSASSVDLVVVGDVSKKKVLDVVSQIEDYEGRELSYTIFPYEEFYYRLSVRDKFLTSVLANKHVVVLDTDNILKEA